MLSALYRLTAAQNDFLQAQRTHPLQAQMSVLTKEVSTTRELIQKSIPTGWEKEKTTLFAPAYQPTPPQLGMAGIPGDLGGIGRAVVQLGHHLEGIGDVAPSYIARPHTDRKARQRERELKIAHGHAEDDHEEYQGPNLSM